VRLLFSLSVAIAMTAGFAARGQNLVYNGNFNLNPSGTQAEPTPGQSGPGSGEGSLLGWSTSGGIPLGNVGKSVMYIDTPPYGSAGYPVLTSPGVTYGGLYPYYAQLGGTLAPNNIFEDVPTISGDKYQVTFYLSLTPGFLNVGTFDATFGSTTLLNLTSANDASYVTGGTAGWTETVSGDITASSPSTDLQFLYTTLGEWNLTDISVVAVPSVSTTVPDSGVGFGLIAATLLGLCGVSFYTNRRPCLA
jgi:hypothetical protein